MVQHHRQHTVMKHDFSKVPHADIPRSSFSRSHGHKTTFEAGLLIPIYADEALPGDTFNLNLSSIARLTTPLFPLMDNMIMDYFFFAVPNRLLWTNWERFMGSQDNPADSTDFLVPQIALGGAGAAAGQLADHMGVPTGVNAPVNALHFRAYNLIYNEWFRDQNLQDSVVVDLDDGLDNIDDYVLLRRGKRHDYFTSCLPWPQKIAGVELPLGSEAPIITGTDRTFVSAETPMRMWDPVDGTYDAGNKILGLTAGEVGIATGTHVQTEEAVPSNLYADLANATAATINSLREAFQLQKLLERDARGGTRYTEIIKAHFRVDSPDSRLQRPEYLGGGSAPVGIMPVARTTGTFTGDLHGYGVQATSGIGFTKSFVEHCTLLGMVCVRADLTYQYGLDRMWSRQTKYDFYWPALAHLGEQEVLNKEIWWDASANDDLVFGYQERWAEYRYSMSKITGLMRSINPATLDAWHLSQEFGSLPVLNDEFIVDEPPIDRVVTVTDEDHFKFDGYFDIKCARPMPTYSVPGLIDHF